MTQPLKINMSNTHSASHSAANFSRVQRYKEEQERKRKKYIKAVKTAQRQLCMDDATYRVMLEARTGQRSATDCTLAQLGAVLDHLRRAGATHPNAGSKRRLVPTADKASMMQKVWALLGELERVTGQPHSMAYADAICQRNQWCSLVDFANPQILHQLVGALNRTLRTKASVASHGQQRR
jgi:phage gp16-like protein